MGKIIDECVICGTNEAVVFVTCGDGSMIFICEKCLSKQEQQPEIYPDCDGSEDEKVKPVCDAGGGNRGYLINLTD